jgi:DNA-binding transcriptional LysR family regulator
MMMLSNIAMNLSSLDLNLFVVLHVVLEERSATRAAKRLHVTQSAVSNAIARLRTALGDPLFVRSGRGLVPTPCAEGLAPLVAQAIAHLQSAYDRGAAFAPEASERTFTLALSDNHQTSEAARIAAGFARKLPRSSLRFVSNDYLVATDGLARGDVDAAFAPSMMQAPGVHAQQVFEEQACMVVRRDHPKLRGKLTPKLFNALKHIDVEVVLGRTGIGHRMAEQHWKAAGLERKVAVRVPYFTTAAMIAARTDCVAGLPSRLANVLCETMPLKIVATTFPLPKMGISLIWHERTDADPGARYFRQLVAEAVGVVDRTGRPSPPARPPR